MTLLVVDDDVSVRDFIRRALRRLGFAVLDAENTLRAAELFKSQACDLALIDVNIGALDGTLLARSLLRAKPGLPILMMSGDPLNAEKVERAGLGPLLAKPFGIETLTARVLRALAAGRPR